MGSKAGPSSPKKKLSDTVISDEAMSDVEGSDAERQSVDSNAIDDQEVQTPKPARTSKPGRKSASLPRYQAPAGMSSVAVSSAFKTSPFEFDALQAKKGVELWAIRVPADFKPSRLSSLALDRPTKNGVKGRLERSGGAYSLVNATEDGEGIGAEMAGMNLLVPKMKASGQLMRAPIKISRRLILTPVDGKAASSEYEAPEKVKRTQPEHKLKFRNRAFGFDTPGPSATAGEDDDEKEDDEDATAAPEDSPAKSPKKSSKKDDKDSKRKKSKSDADRSSPEKKKRKVKE